MVLSEPSTLYGRPTTISAGCQSRSSASIVSQGGEPDFTASASSGEAVRLTVSPHATPMRLSPKSKARTSRGAAPAGRSGVAGSGIAADRADARQLHPPETPRRLPARFEGQIEDQVGIHRRTEPCIGPDLIFELTAAPAGIP